MTTFQKRTNKMVTCPFDPAHKCLESRLQMHITKCRLNHLDKDKEVCPFNAQHRIDRGSMDYHIMNCADRAPLDKQLAAKSDKNNIFKGCTSVPCYTQNIDTGNESWENEINRDGQAGYTPHLAPPKGGIITDLGLAKPAARKQYYKNLHIRDDDGQFEGSTPSCRIPQKRQPKELPEVLLIQGNAAQNIENLGLGRGQPVGGSSRIAAKIFGPQNQNHTPAVPAQSYSQIIAGVRELNLGLGRGNGKPASPMSYDDSEFPPLGFGRGAPRLTKEVKSPVKE